MTKKTLNVPERAVEQIKNTHLIRFGHFVHQISELFLHVLLVERLVSRCGSDLVSARVL